MTSEGVVNCYVRGRTISLRHPTQEDIVGGWTEWFSDPDITRHLPDQYWPNSTEAQGRYYESLLAQRERLSLSVVHNADGRLIGTCSLSSINVAHRYATVAVVIGDKRFHRAGIGVEAYNLILEVAFRRLNLMTVLSFSSSMNTAVHGVHRLVGFAERGVIPGVFDYDGRRIDMVVSSVLRDDWMERQSPRRADGTVGAQS